MDIHCKSYLSQILCPVMIFHFFNPLFDLVFHYFVCLLNKFLGMRSSRTSIDYFNSVGFQKNQSSTFEFFSVIALGNIWNINMHSIGLQTFCHAGRFLIKHGIKYIELTIMTLEMADLFYISIFLRSHINKIHLYLFQNSGINNWLQRCLSIIFFIV